jgi:hypothetical protein
MSNRNFAELTRRIEDVRHFFPIIGQQNPKTRNFNLSITHRDASRQTHALSFPTPIAESRIKTPSRSDPTALRFALCILTFIDPTSSNDLPY